MQTTQWMVLKAILIQVGYGLKDRILSDSGLSTELITGETFYPLLTRALVTESLSVKNWSPDWPAMETSFELFQLY
jgi:hypothetical protein